MANMMTPENGGRCQDHVHRIDPFPTRVWPCPCTPAVSCNLVQCFELQEKLTTLHQ